MAALTALPGCGDDPLNDLVPSGSMCGQDNQACCPGNTCWHGASCSFTDMRCRAPALRSPNECRSWDECSSGHCGGTMGGNAYDCPNARACFFCQADFPFANVPLGGACDTSAQCRTGLCMNQRCTLPCRYGSTGDALCRSQVGGGNDFCAVVAFVPRNGMPTSNTSLTLCMRRCSGENPCPNGMMCVPNNDGLHMRSDTICIYPERNP